MTQIRCAENGSALPSIFAFLLGLTALPTFAADVPALPEAVSQQLVLQSEIRSKQYIVSFGGMGAGLSASAAHSKAWQLNEGQSNWTPVPAIPNQSRKSHRLSATGLAMSNHFYVFSGYSFNSSQQPETLSDSYRFSPVTQTYTRLPDMPVAVDSAVALSYQDRYIYLVTGRHQGHAVNLVQVFDNFTQKWSQATPFPGKPVFGQAGAMIDNQMLLCDGAHLSALTQQTSLESTCYLGTIDPKSVQQIQWQQVAHHGQKPRFMQTAVSVRIEDRPMIAFLGGSEQAHDAFGKTQQGEAARASDAVYVFDLEQRRWRQAKPSQAVMNHRSLVRQGADFVSVGGQWSDNQVSSQSIKHQIKLLPE